MVSCRQGHETMGNCIKLVKGCEVMKKALKMLSRGVQLCRKKLQKGVELWKVHPKNRKYKFFNSSYLALRIFISHEALPIRICHWQRYVWFWQGVDETKRHKSTSTRYHAIKLYENSFQSLKHTQSYTKNIFIHSISSISRLLSFMASTRVNVSHLISLSRAENFLFYFLALVFFGEEAKKKVGEKNLIRWRSNKFRCCWWWRRWMSGTLMGEKKSYIKSEYWINRYFRYFQSWLVKIFLLPPRIFFWTVKEVEKVYFKLLTIHFNVEFIFVPGRTIFVVIIELMIIYLFLVRAIFNIEFRRGWWWKVVLNGYWRSW